MSLGKSLFAHYESYHRHGPLMLRYAGIFGTIAFPLLYLLRFARGTAAYDDLPVRLVATVLCLLLLLKDRWPSRLKPYYLAFSYPALIFSLPFAFIFSALKSGGGSLGVASTLMVIFFIILITDWRNTIVMLVAGAGAAAAVYIATDPAPRIPADYLTRLPTFVLVIVGGSLFKLAGHRAAAEQMRIAYASIAGTMAHELRNPLAQIRHNLERMQAAMPQPGARLEDPVRIDALYRGLAESELAVERGLQLISMTLDEVAQKPLDASVFSHLSAADVTRKAVREYSYEDEDQRSRVSVRVERDFTFRAEETAYLFVLFNLIKNALFYLAPHPDTQLEITVGHQLVKVRDNGPGIPPDVLPVLFEPFRTRGKSGGTGLGLAYCKRAMRAMGGDITCQSVCGSFTEFTISFPAVTAQELEAHRSAVLVRARQVFHGLRLLVVDDDAALRTITRHKLAPLEATVDDAADGLQAVAMLRQRTYDLVVLDLAMPGMDGYGLADALRQGAAPLNRDVPLVAYTSEPAHLARVKTLKSGIGHFVSKPCDQLALVQALLGALGTRPAPAPADRLKGLHVLVADDSAFNRRAVAAYLEHAGAAVHQASDGRAVLAKLAQVSTIHAVLLDINMPGMDGLETARAIRAAASPWRCVPILGLSASSDAGIVAAARAAGMADFITKPVEPARLYASLRSLCGLPDDRTIAAQPAALPASRHGPLLDLKRLDDYRHMGMLNELLSDYVPEIARLVGMLRACVASEDLRRTLDVLHSLVGLSGEAGAAALHRLSRAHYISMTEAQEWPANPGWVEELGVLAAQSERALSGCAPAPDTAEESKP